MSTTIASSSADPVATGASGGWPAGLDALLESPPERTAGTRPPVTQIAQAGTSRACGLDASSANAAIGTALAGARQQVARAMQALTRFDSQDRQAFMTWFGDGCNFGPFGCPSEEQIQSARAKVLGNYKSIAAFLNQASVGNFVAGQPCRPNFYGGHVVGTRTIELQPLWASAPMSGTPDSKVGTIIHEASHVAARTSDLTYRAMTTMEGQFKQRNAENYSGFAFAVGR